MCFVATFENRKKTMHENDKIIIYLLLHPAKNKF